jgi:hypothetical protein
MLFLGTATIVTLILIQILHGSRMLTEMVLMTELFKFLAFNQLDLFYPHREEIVMIPTQLGTPGNLKSATEKIITVMDK